MNDYKERYLALKKLINERQAFENREENNIPPYNNYRTDLNFCDSYGYSLLHYASLLGDTEAIVDLIAGRAELEVPPLFTSERKSPFQMALENGHLESAKILFEHGASPTRIPLAMIHKNCKQWFIDEMKNSLNKSYENYKTGDSSFSETSRFFNFSSSTSITLLFRIVELGDLDSLKLFPIKTLDESSKLNLMKYAISNGHYEVYQFVQTQLDPDSIEKLNLQYPLHVAIEHKQHDFVDKLLNEIKNTTLNTQNGKKQTPLMLAIKANDVSMIKKLMTYHLDIMERDIYGNTALHYAVQQKSPEMISLLLNHKGSNAILNQKNIYGFTPADYAIFSGEDNLILCFYKPDDLAKIKQESNYGKMPAPINQAALLSKLHFFLRLLYRDTSLFYNEGHCFGFSFLKNYYNALKKSSHYFMNTLSLIANWDGNEKMLYHPFPSNMAQSQYYANLASLFDHWIQDIIWFQAKASEKIFPMRKKQEDNLIGIFDLVAPSNDRNNAIQTIYCEHHIKMIEAHLQEYLSLFKRMPYETKVIISGSLHATCCDVIKSQKHIPDDEKQTEMRAKQLDFYDPNFQHPLNDDLNDQLSTLIFDSKYRALDLLLENDIAEIDFYLYYFKNNCDQKLFHEFELFEPHELPKNVEDAKIYQENSACKNTPLHAAVITGSVVTFKTLLEDGYCDVTSENIFRKTVFDMIIASKNTAMLRLLLVHSKEHIKNIDYVLLNTDLWAEKSDFSDLLYEYATPTALSSVCINAMQKNRLDLVVDIISNNPTIINTPSYDNKTLLYQALTLKEAEPRLVELLLKKGASALIPANIDKEVVIYDDEPPTQVIPLELIIQNMPHYISVIYKDNHPQIFNFLELFLKDDIEKAQANLNENTFDLSNELHNATLRILLDLTLKNNNIDAVMMLLPYCDKTILESNYDGKPLLVYAISNSNFAMFNYLLERGAPVNATTNIGNNTPLHIALKTDMNSDLRLRFIQLLLENNASTSIPDNDDFTANQLAMDQNNEIKALFLNPLQHFTIFNNQP